MDYHEKRRIDKFSQAAEFPDEKKPYQSPHFDCYGDIRQVTLGGSPGLDDSGSEFVLEPPSLP